MSGLIPPSTVRCWRSGSARSRTKLWAAHRRQQAAHGVARIGPVYTPPQLRGHGYGSAVTAAATRDALAAATVSVLFTDLANPTSNAICQRLGFRPVSDHLLVRFP